MCHTKILRIFNLSQISKIHIYINKVSKYQNSYGLRDNTENEVDNS